MHVLKSSDPQIARRFIIAVCSAGFISFDVDRFLADNVKDESVDDYLLEVLQLSYEDIVALLTPYGETSCTNRDILQSQLAMKLNGSLCYIPHESEASKKPSPIYPKWRGHKIDNKRRGRS